MWSAGAKAWEASTEKMLLLLQSGKHPVVFVLVSQRFSRTCGKIGISISKAVCHYSGLPCWQNTWQLFLLDFFENAAVSC